jgi:hypothetical protein
MTFHPFIHQWLHSSLLGPGLFFSFVIFFKQKVGLLGRRISPPQSRYLHTGQDKHRITAHTNIPALSGISTHDPSVRAGEDSSCPIPRGHYDRHRMTFTTRTSVRCPFCAVTWLTKLVTRCRAARVTQPPYSKQSWLKVHNDISFTVGVLRNKAAPDLQQPELRSLLVLEQIEDCIRNVACWNGWRLLRHVNQEMNLRNEQQTSKYRTWCKSVNRTPYCVYTVDHRTAKQMQHRLSHIIVKLLLVRGTWVIKVRNSLTLAQLWHSFFHILPAQQGPSSDRRDSRWREPNLDVKREGR